MVKQKPKTRAAIISAVQKYRDTCDVIMTTKYGGHYYSRPGTDAYPSVTGIMGILDKGGLGKWMVNQTCDALHKMIDAMDVDDPNASDLTQYFHTMIDQAKTASDTSRDRAADFGTLVHKLIETYAFTEDMRIPDIPDVAIPDEIDAEAACEQAQYALSYMSANDLEPIVAELPVMSLANVSHHRNDRSPSYGGTIDMIAIDADNTLHICDWKTSNYQHNTHKYQLGAYALAFAFSTGLTIGGASVIYTKLGKHVDLGSVGLALNRDVFCNIARVWNDTHVTTDLYHGEVGSIAA